MKVETIFYGDMSIPELPARLNLGMDRRLLGDLSEHKGVLFVHLHGLMFILPCQRIQEKLRLLEAWEKLESPQIRRPDFMIEKHDLVPCSKEVIQALTTETA